MAVCSGSCGSVSRKPPLETRLAKLRLASEMLFRLPCTTLSVMWKRLFEEETFWSVGVRDSDKPAVRKPAARRGVAAI